MSSEIPIDPQIEKLLEYLSASNHFAKFGAIRAMSLKPLAWSLQYTFCMVEFLFEITNDKRKSKTVGYFLFKNLNSDAQISSGTYRLDVIEEVSKIIPLSDDNFVRFGVCKIEKDKTSKLLHIFHAEGRIKRIQREILAGKKLGKSDTLFIESINLPKGEDLLSSSLPNIQEKARDFLENFKVYQKNFPLLRATTSSKENSSLVIAAYEKSKTVDASQLHEHALWILSAFLKNYGHTLAYNNLIDGYCKIFSSEAIFEVKSITEDNESQQVRSAIAQLYEYRYKHGLHSASLWILLTRPAFQDWLLPYIEDDRSINLLWIENGKIGGPSFGKLETLVVETHA